MRIIAIGDVVGPAGMEAVRQYLPRAIAEWKIDLAVVNGENASGPGFGIGRAEVDDLLEAGADVITLGNHSWNRREALEFIADTPQLIRPINYLPGTPGRGATVVTTRRGQRALVLNALGRLFMEPSEDPFSRIEKEIMACPLGSSADAIIVDFHCESAGEKQAAGHFCDGRVSLVFGTHTHTPTADYRILAGGTGFITDAGMTGDYGSIIGMKPEEPLRRFTTGIPQGRFEPATGNGTLCGVAVETDDATGLAIRIAPVRLGGCLETDAPSFW